MKVVLLSASAIVFIALIALSDSVTARPNLPQVRTVPISAFAPASSASTVVQPAQKPPVRAQQHRRPGSLDCLTIESRGRRGSDIVPSDSLTQNWEVVREGNAVRRVRIQPEVGTPENGQSLPRSGSLDEGSDACPATVINHLPFEDSGEIAGLNDDFVSSCNPGVATPDVIYQFTSPVAARYMIALVSGHNNSSISVRTDGGCPGSRELGCNGDQGVQLHRLFVRLTAGQTCYIIADVAPISTGRYSLSMMEVGECSPDFVLTAPGTVSGSTCFARDDCPLAAGEDQMVQVTIPYTGDWNFALCDGQQWPAQILLTDSCCNSSVIAHTDHGCWYSGNFSRPSLYVSGLSAGVYYVNIEGNNSTACGAWTLSVESGINCTSTPPNDNCSSIGEPVTLPATFIGDNTCATNDCNLLTEGDGETWHAFRLDTPSSVMLEGCQSNYLYNVLVTGCPGTALIPASEFGYGTCNSWNGITLLFRDLPAGVYYYPVVRRDNYSARGPYSIGARVVPTCTVLPQSGDVIECLDDPEISGGGTDCDRGCDSQAFLPIQLGDAVYGRAYSYLIGGTTTRRMDADWYEFEVTDTTAVSVTIQSELPVGVGIYDRDCRAYSYYAYDQTVSPCSTLTVATRCLRPNTYALVVQPTGFMASEDTLHYRFTLTSAACQWPVVIVQQPGDILESEPICQDNYQDNYNVGCSGGYQNQFMPIACGDTILGSSGVFNSGTYLNFDADWYSFSTTGRSSITMNVVAEFDPYLIISNYCPGCDGGLDERGGYAGDTVRVSVPCWNASPFYVGIIPNNWSHLPCGAKYRMWITCESCLTCTALQQPQDIIENEPACSTYVTHADHFNGGCTSDPPVFGPDLQCGQSIWGTSGTWWHNGGMRDTDWLRFTLNSSQTSRLSVVAQFTVMAAIVGPGPNGNCDSVNVYSDVAFGNSCDTVTVQSNGVLSPGSYWLFIAPTDYSNVLCGSEYHAWVDCSPCEPFQVRNLTARRDGDNIVLRWTSDPSFTGTYRIYRSARYNDLQSGTYETLAQGLATVPGTNRAIYTDINALQSGDMQFYTVVGVCP